MLNAANCQPAPLLTEGLCTLSGCICFPGAPSTCRQLQWWHEGALFGLRLFWKGTCHGCWQCDCPAACNTACWQVLCVSPQRLCVGTGQSTDDEQNIIFLSYCPQYYSNPCNTYLLCSTAWISLGYTSAVAPPSLPARKPLYHSDAKTLVNQREAAFGSDAWDEVSWVSWANPAASSPESFLPPMPNSV